MDRRSLRNNKRQHRTTRTRERPNQGLVDKVKSKFLSFFNLWNSAPGEQPGSSSESDEDVIQEPEFVPQNTTQSSKRPRLRLHDHSPPGCSNSSILAEPSLDNDYTSQISSRGIKRLRLREHEIPGCSTDAFSETMPQPDYNTTQNSSLGSKRQRLKLPDHNVSISKAETEIWLDPERPNVFSQASSHMPSSSAQNSLIENKESSVILNGDDHSENSEGSASTSGCSSLVSHKDRVNCLSSIILSESDLKNRRYISSQKGKLPGDIGSNRVSLWSTNESSAVRSIRSPSLMRSSQPGFNLSAFVGSTKPAERKVASPFYQGKTTYGGASASRRMPIAAAPYQVDKPLINQIKLRSNQPKDSYEGMSSAAKRILQTLEKMSSPVTDAKKIPNTNKSPVDLSLYLMPPKHRRTLQSTPSGPSKGPPIADISTISKLTTIKNYGQRRFQNTILDSPTLLGEETSSILNNVLPQMPLSSTASPTLPSGGGKMKSKLNQHHQPAAKSKFGLNVSEMESRLSEYIDAIGDTTELPDIPLPITSLPTINFGSSLVKQLSDLNQLGKDFVFSVPIEYSVQADKDDSLISDFVPPWSSPFTNSLSTSASTLAKEKTSPSLRTFTFSNPIELENPISSVPSSRTNELSSKTDKLSSKTENFKQNSTANSVNKSTTWECNSCWVRNPETEIKCLCCETLRPSSSSALVKSASSVPATTSTSGLSTSSANSVATWECTSCWVRNPSNETKCMCCETPNPKGSTSSSATDSTISNSKSFNNGSFKIPPPTTASSCTFGSLKITPTTASNSTFGSFKIPPKTSNSSSDSPKIPPVTTSQPSSGINPSNVFNASKVPPVSSSWECDVCLVRNELDKQKCMACESLRPNKNLMGSATVAKRLMNSPASVPSSFQSSNTVKSAASISEASKSTFTVGTKSDSPNLFLKTKPQISADNPLLKPFTPTSLSKVAENSLPLSTSKNADNALEKTPSEPFRFGSTTNSSTATTATSPVFQFGSKVSSEDSTKQCISCKNKSEEERKNCAVCHAGSNALKSLPEFGLKSSSSTFKFSSPSSNITITPSSVSLKTTDSSEVKNEAEQLPIVSEESKTVTPPSVPVFGKSVTTAFDKPDAPKVFSFGTVTSSSSSDVFPPNASVPSEKTGLGTPKNQSKAEETSKSNTISSAEKKESEVAPKSTFSEPPASSTATTSTPVFQFGSQLSSTTTSASSFTKPTNVGFSFGVKTEAANQLISSSQTSASESKPVQSLFGNAAPAFGKTSDASKGFNFGSTSTSNAAPVFQFGSTALTPSEKSSGDCPSCKGKSDEFKKNCAQCHPGKKVSDGTVSKPVSTGGFQTIPLSTPANVFQFGSQSSNSPASSTVFSKPITSFSFGVKNETANQQLASQGSAFGNPPSQSLFGNSTSTFAKPSDTPGGFNFGAAVSSTATPVFQFGSSVSTDNSSWECTNCRTKNENDKQNCKSCNTRRSEKNVSGFTFKGVNEIKPNASTIQFNAPTTTTATSSGFTFSANPASTSGGFVFGLKSEPPTTASSVFTFGSSTSGTSKPSITGFDSTLSSTPVVPFQFGSQTAIATPAPSFGAASNTFSFGAKTETVNPLQPATASSQIQAPAFGNAPTQPMFGSNTASPAFGKQAPGGFNFGQPTASNATPVFQFGAEKKQATQSGFSFGTPSQDTSGFQPQFNISTPPSFNFGATATPGPFQFAASSDSSQHAAPTQRKIRKALRRMK